MRLISPAAIRWALAPINYLKLLYLNSVLTHQSTLSALKRVYIYKLPIRQNTLLRHH